MSARLIGTDIGFFFKTFPVQLGEMDYSMLEFKEGCNYSNLCAEGYNKECGNNPEKCVLKIGIQISLSKDLEAKW